MISKSTNEGKGILLYRQILSVTDYRKLCGLPDCIGKTLNRLKEQLAEPSGPGKDFWWCPVTDLELLKVKIVDEPIKVAIVTDGKSAIICELPDSIEGNLFVDVD